MSSAWRELRAIQIFVSVHLETLRSNQVLCYTDNQSVRAVLRKGSMKPGLQDLALEIFKMCLKYSIALNIAWIPREHNQEADDLSKVKDLDN